MKSKINFKVLFIFSLTLINVILTSTLMNSLYENMSLQKEFILSHPVKYSLILLSNILKNYNFFFSFTTNFTILHNIFFPKQCVQLLYFIALLICVFKEEVNLDLSKISKFIIGLFGLFIIILSYTSVYLHWREVEVGSTYVAGMQARYYIPVMLMYLIIISGKKDVIKISDDIPCFIALWVNFTIVINVMMCVI